ncbi:uncharacterized protein (TIGR02421 family) [Allocatelliglobosispora scoriae]|uniref:Uncharacterized protein (TIGR02421 family) n=1 Tax=Allocatelliglobosispora scoriae TaxID=643052 RepID=A0A841BYU5_9ACTN|nr:tyrosine/phenylalanine carboxypeptidase domain-containing protein [Allocatelliglobosispora scoriae]MBB5872746.1 uncharacterized protein (TIGR02421 family) [Allocatelliglobosispora scoriae]
MSLDIGAVNKASELVVGVGRALRYAHFITPLNQRESRVAYLSAWNSGQAIDPVFEYLEPTADTLDAIGRATAALPDDSAWRERLNREIEAARIGHEALVTHDPATMTAYALGQFGSPTDEGLAQALDYLAHHPRQGPGPVQWTADRAAGIMTEVLAKAELGDWAVEVDDHMAARMSVTGVKRLLRVKQGAMFTPAEVRRLIVHEIGTHVARTVNGNSQPLTLLAHGITGYMGTEEGLAVWHEQQEGVSDVNVMRTYAMRVVACHKAMTGGFGEVFAAVLPHTTPEDAFGITLRIKRGLIDTSQPGGYIKDHVYFMGALAVAGHLDQASSDHELLLATKWPLAEIEALRDLREQGLLLEPIVRTSMIAAFAQEVMSSYRGSDLTS